MSFSYQYVECPENCLVIFTNTFQGKIFLYRVQYDNSPTVCCEGHIDGMIYDAAISAITIPRRLALIEKKTTLAAHICGTKLEAPRNSRL